MTAALTPRNVVIAVLMLLLAAVPVLAAVTANPFLVTLFTRVIILGMAATSLSQNAGRIPSSSTPIFLPSSPYPLSALTRAATASPSSDDCNIASI
jgi:hypothetical protein